MVYLTCAIIGLVGRGVIKTWTEVAARLRLYMLMSDLTSLVPPQFSHWLQVRKVGTIYFILFFWRQMTEILMIMLPWIYLVLSSLILACCTTP